MRWVHGISIFALIVLSLVHVGMTPVFFGKFAMQVMWYVAQGLMGLLIAFLNLAVRRISWSEPGVVGMTRAANLLGLAFAVLYATVDLSIPSLVAVGLFAVIVVSEIGTARGSLSA